MKSKRARRQKLGLLPTLAIVLAAYLSASPLEFRRGERDVASVILPNASKTLLAPYGWRDMNIERTVLGAYLPKRHAYFDGVYGGFAEHEYANDIGNSPFFNLKPQTVADTLMAEVQYTLNGIQRADQIMRAQFDAQYPGVMSDPAPVYSPFATRGDGLPLAYGGLASDQGTAWGANDLGIAAQSRGIADAQRRTVNVALDPGKRLAAPALPKTTPAPNAVGATPTGFVNGNVSIAK